jgi:hypothetical protein
VVVATSCSASSQVSNRVAKQVGFSPRAAAAVRGCQRLSEHERLVYPVDALLSDHVEETAVLVDAARVDSGQGELVEDDAGLGPGQRVGVVAVSQFPARLMQADHGGCDGLGRQRERGEHVVDDLRGGAARERA